MNQSAIARLRAEAAQEASQRVERLTLAQTMGATIKPEGRSRPYRGDPDDLIVMRDPCGRCGVRRDVHDGFGCKRWRA